MFAGIINAHLAIVPDCKAARLREARIVQIVLRAGRGGVAKFGWPPVMRGLAGSLDEETDARVTAAVLSRSDWLATGRLNEG